MPPRLIFGAGSIGYSPEGFTYTWRTPEDVSDLLEVLKRLGLTELDSAAVYPPGAPFGADRLLGQSKAAEKGFVVGTKAMLDAEKMMGPDPEPQLDYDALLSSINQQLEAIGVEKLALFYAHWPDAHTPIEVQAEAFDRLHKAGKFEKLGLSNYSVKNMEDYLAVCEEKGYVKPSVYQGHYNALYRDMEDKLLPLLRKHNCVFYAYSPLAGGFLTGKVTLAKQSQSPDAVDKTLDRTRWHGKAAHPLYTTTFDTPVMHQAILDAKAVCDAASPPISLHDAAMRWLMHHSALGDDDAVIVGAKRVDQLEGNVAGARGGRLEGEVLKAIDGMWNQVNGKFQSAFNKL